MLKKCNVLAFPQITLPAPSKGKLSSTKLVSDTKGLGITKLKDNYFLLKNS